MSNKIDAQFIQPFIDATAATLKVQCKIETKLGKPYLKDDKTKESHAIDIAGVLGITSDTFNGSICLCFPQATFIHILNSMLGENYTTITKEVEDGAAELLNIIFGYAKRVLNNGGSKLQKALPNVISGNGIQVHHPSQAPIIVLPFQTSQGPFHIEISTLPIAKAA